MPSVRTALALLCAGSVISTGMWTAAPTASAQAPTEIPTEEPTAQPEISELPNEVPTEEPTAQPEVSEAPTEPVSALAAPDVPRDVGAKGNDQSLEVQWEAPASSGGSPIVEYEVLAIPRNDELAKRTATVAADRTQATIPSLVNGAIYDVQVRAKNALAYSQPGGCSGTPRTVPRAPRIGAARAGDHYAVATWTAPVDDGGADLDGFIVTASPSGKVERVGAGATSAKFTRLRNGVATTFTVKASNVAGAGAASASSSRVIPRGVARFVVERQPKHNVLYGLRSSVRTALVTDDGTGVPNQQVDLMAKLGASRWHRVDTARTDVRGRATLGTTLRASAKLRLRHPASVVSAESRDIRAVVVAKTVSRSVSAKQVRLGKTVVVTGRVAPRHRVGSKVQLQRRVWGSWVTIDTGRMSSQRRYRLRWQPQRVGSYVLRVRKPAGDALAAGISRRWFQRVNPESAADIAADIMRDGGIELATVHLSAGRDGASARDNIVDVANGRLAQHSCHGGAPCGATRMDLRVLRAVRQMGTRGTLTVSEFAGGAHAGSSAHYSGKAVDITWVNGSHVGYGSSYGMVVDLCRAHGANQIFAPYSDPYGGHSRHVHCGW